MSSYYAPLNDMAMDGRGLSPLSPASLNPPQISPARDAHLDRILGTTMAILNQTQAELDHSRKQIAQLKKQLMELEQAATTDLLTGLKNRRGFEAAFAAELDRTQRGKSGGGVLVVIDLDAFKAINDTFGHQAGDECLRIVARALSAEIRDMDTAARLGGDEFVLLLTDTDPEQLLTRVQNMAWKLNHLCLIWEGQKIAIHASIGMKPYGKGDKADTIFSAADTQMYSDKKRAKQMN